MKYYVLDSFALLVFFQQQRDWKKVESFLVKAAEDEIELLISGINYGEVYYVTSQRYGDEVAKQIIKEIDSLPIKIIYPDKELTLESAQVKAKGGLSYADCFAFSLTKKFKAKLVTGDIEFKKLAGDISIEWIEK